VVTADCRPRRLGDDPINCRPSNAQCSGQPLGRPQREPRALQAGKTFFLEAPGQLAVEQGLHVAWFTLEDLGGLIRRHRADDTVAKAIRAILRAELIVVEDIGLYRSHRTPPKASTAASTPPTVRSGGHLRSGFRAARGQILVALDNRAPSVAGHVSSRPAPPGGAGTGCGRPEPWVPPFRMVVPSRVTTSSSAPRVRTPDERAGMGHPQEQPETDSARFMFARRRSLLAGVLSGIGIAAFLDETVFHQLLHWHHFYDRSTSDVGLVSDGLFHAFGWLAIVLGLFLFADLQRRRSAIPVRLWAGVLTGWGGFQLYDGVIQHKVLGLHQIRYAVPLVPYDLAWNIAGGAALVVGLLLLRRFQGRSTRPGQGD